MALGRCAGEIVGGSGLLTNCQPLSSYRAEAYGLHAVCSALSEYDGPIHLHLDNEGLTKTYGHMQQPLTLAHEEPQCDADVMDEIRHHNDIRLKLGKGPLSVSWWPSHPERRHQLEDGSPDYSLYDFHDFGNSMADAMCELIKSCTFGTIAHIENYYSCSNVVHHGVE